MSVSPNLAAQAVVNFKTPRPGSCITLEFLAELKALFSIEFPTNSQLAEMKASGDSGNLSVVAGDGGIYTPAALFFSDTLPFVSSQVTFTGWDQAIDARTCLLNFFALYDATEVGQPAQRDPSGATINVRPTVELVRVSATTVVLTVRNNSEPCQLTLQLFQPATPET